MTGTPHAEMRSTPYELFFALLGLLSILNLVIVVVPFTGGAGKQVVLAIEILLTPIFLADFLLRLGTARPRRAYVVRGWGWA